MFMLDWCWNTFCKSFDCSCMAEGLFDESFNLVIDYMLIESCMLC